MSKTFAVLDETGQFESRVGLTPDVAARFLKTYKGEEKIELLLEKGAGEKAFYSDVEYEKAGVKLVTKAEALKANYIGFISRPTTATIKKLKKGQTAVGLFGSWSDAKVAEEFKAQGVRAIDINKLPRQLSMAQSMDAMTSQNSVAGYKSVLLAANEFAGFFPMLTTAAGTVRPASVLILGAGIAGLQAIGTAKRLGAVVTAFDVRPASEEEVKSLGAKFLDLGKYGAADVMAALSQGQGEGGYARKLSDEELAKQKAATDKAVADFDIVITTAQVPGSKPPEFVSKEGLKNMKPGSVVVDLAASKLGGNVEGSKPEATVEMGGVKIIGAPTLASKTAKAASSMLARNICDVVSYVAEADSSAIDLGELAVMVITADPEPVKTEVKTEVKAKENLDEEMFASAKGSNPRELEGESNSCPVPNKGIEDEGAQVKEEGKNK
ncbi:MAG: NAD(P) transhydrogenase subunit alpha [Candidatus Ancillula sp.]|jgi:NAD(P) transhydrogenase subunit alpha|nr:NAD(P) transhydrogenase subunit alpha [Candidatus Ancillula sp.]